MSSFYQRGLKFECQKDCSHCCGGSPGYVWLSQHDIDTISEHLQISTSEFIANYTKKMGPNYSLIDLEDDNWNCILLKNGKCSIYNIRPMQCRTYPFWPQNIESERAWKEQQNSCPGIGKGRTYQAEEIEAISDGRAAINSIK